MDKGKYKILIAEDDPIFRETVREIVEDEGFLVEDVENGKEAKELIELQDFDVIISDVKMPKMSGVDLVEWVREKYNPSSGSKKDLPIILMTGFSHIVETQKAHELGVQEFLSKPFEDKELIASVRRVLGLSQEKQNGPNSRDSGEGEFGFYQVLIEDFLKDREMKMDVYVKLSTDKFIKILHRGSRIDCSKIKSYKDRGINCLYIRREDFIELFSKAG